MDIYLFFFVVVKLDVRHQLSSPRTVLRTGLPLFMLGNRLDISKIHLTFNI